MTRRIVVRKTARADILDISDYLAANAPAPIGIRFARALRQTLSFVATQPGVGRAQPLSPQLPGLRSRPVDGFTKYLVFYLAMASTLDVVRVVRGSRDLNALFRDDPDLP